MTDHEHTPPTEAELDEWDGAANAAERGPWHRTGTDVWAMHVPRIVVFGRRDGDWPGRVHDLVFIVQARDAMPRLIAEVRRLRAENAGLRAWGDHLESVVRQEPTP